MAKKKKKAAPPTPRFESAGWTFFSILTVVLTGPFTGLAWLISYENTEWYTRVGMGLVFSAFVSAILTTLANSALQYRAERLKKQTKKRGAKR